MVKPLALIHVINYSIYHKFFANLETLPSWKRSPLASGRQSYPSSSAEFINGLIKNQRLPVIYIALAQFESLWVQSLPLVLVRM